MNSSHKLVQVFLGRPGHTLGICNGVKQRHHYVTRPVQQQRQHICRHTRCWLGLPGRRLGRPHRPQVLPTTCHSFTARPRSCMIITHPPCSVLVAKRMPLSAVPAQVDREASPETSSATGSSHHTPLVRGDPDTMSLSRHLPCTVRVIATRVSLFVEPSWWLRNLGRWLK